MKKIFSAILAVAMILSVTSVSVGAVDIKSDSTENISTQMCLPCTYENAMPEISSSCKTNVLTEQETLLLPERQEWVKETTEALQEAYYEKVVSVYETETTVVFEFEEPNPAEFLFGENYIMK